MSHYKRYPAYKDSGVEWLGDIPAHWELHRLKRCLRLVTKKAAERCHPVALENIESWTGRYIASDSEFEADGIGFEPGDILFGKLRPYLAKVLWAEFSGEAVGDIYVMRPEPGTLGQYAEYQVLNKEFIKTVDSATFGTKMPRVSWGFLGDMAMLCPPPNEQKGIATFLDRETSRIDALITKKTLFIELLREKRQALITRAVTKGLDPNVKMKDSGVEWLGEVPAHWEVKAIKRESLVQRGASPRPIDDPVYFDDRGEYAWVRISDVTASEMYLYETEQRLSSLGSSLSVKMQSGSLFLSIAGSVGKPCIAGIKCCIHDGFVYFPGLKKDPKFLFYIFVSGQPYSGLGKMGTQLNLNTDTVASIYIASPPIEEQFGITIFLDRETAKIDSLITRAEQSVALLRERRSALITAAVTGRIDIRQVLPELVD